jgi:predicted alpha/beta-hydrolase family hydrolase
MKEPEELIVKVSQSDSVTALLYAASKRDRAGMTMILGHGAGASQLTPFMRLFASGFAERGFDAMTFNFVYMEQGRRVPDPKAKLEGCYHAVIEAAKRHKKLKGNLLVIGGKSMGGRIASQVAAASNDQALPDSRASAMSASAGIAGLVFLGYPLHPPGKPEQLRDAHLKDIRAPMLFVQGSRDVFGTEAELRAVIKRLHLPATLHAIEGGDHSLKVPRSAGVPQQQVYESTMDDIARWLKTQVREPERR